MNEADRIRLQHMLEAAGEARSLARDESRETLDRDTKLVLALTRIVEILGEAASRISPETRAMLPGIPWTEIVGMRNRLIHAYFDVDLDRLWDTIEKDLPPLVSILEKVLKD